MWRALLLLAFLGLCACLEEDSVLGVVGQPVSLPCLYPGRSTDAESLSIEWRTGGEVVLRSTWEGDRRVEQWSCHNATVSADAGLSGNLSLRLPTVEPKDDNKCYDLFIVSGGNQSAQLCTVCLRIAASFSPPLLQREAAAGEETTFSCHSSGGFPEPAVHWVIDDAEEPPEGSVRTLAAPHPDSHLYNVTSHLKLNVSEDSSVSCIIENQFTNETLTSTSRGVQNGRVKGRASEAMWIFGMAVCVVVGVMVMAGVAYQIHLDKITNRKKKEHQSRGYKRRLHEMETEVLETEPKDTDV